MLEGRRRDLGLRLLRAMEADQNRQRRRRDAWRQKLLDRKLNALLRALLVGERGGRMKPAGSADVPPDSRAPAASPANQRAVGHSSGGSTAQDRPLGRKEEGAG